MVGVSRVMRSEFRIIVFAGLGCSDEALGIGDIVRPAHAYEASGGEAYPAFARGNRFQKNGNVVRVARDDLHEALVGRLHFLVDAAGVGLAESELRSLSQKAFRVAAVVVVLRFIVVAGGESDCDTHRARVSI